MFTRKRMRFNMQIIWQSLFWYFKFTLSMRDIVLMLKDRGVEVLSRFFVNRTFDADI